MEDATRSCKWSTSNFYPSRNFHSAAKARPQRPSYLPESSANRTKVESETLYATVAGGGVTHNGGGKSRQARHAIINGYNPKRTGVKGKKENYGEEKIRGAAGGVSLGVGTGLAWGSMRPKISRHSNTLEHHLGGTWRKV